MTVGNGVWDGSRAIAPRKVLARSRHEADGMVLTLATEDARSPTDWCIDAAHHTIVVHLAGRLRRMESVFEHGPASDVRPEVGDVWVIPADSGYAALAEGDHVSFAEFALPASLETRADLRACIGRRDPFLHHASAKAAALAGRDDPAAKMALDALLDTLRFHIADDYLGGAPGSAPATGADRRLFSARQKNLLTDYIDARKHATIRVAELAALVGLSLPHLLERFKASFGTTPWQYVMRMRLVEARHLLDAGDSSVTAVSLATGFSSPSHFATAFGRHFGVSPNAYRRARRTAGIRKSPHEFEGGITGA